jgi:glycosyltransferase involved in cell wall biosynthesis
VPKVLIEAAACERPIVAADAPGIREIVRDGANSILVPPDAPAALRDALRRLASDGDLRRSMDAKGRAIAEDGFSLEQVIAETLAVYDVLLG